MCSILFITSPCFLHIYPFLFPSTSVNKIDFINKEIICLSYQSV